MSTKLRSALSVRSPVYNHIILRTWHRIHLTKKFALTSQVLRASGQVSSIRGMCWSACAKSTETLRCRISGKIWHYNDVIMNATASQITSLTIVYSTVYSGIGQRKQQSSASLSFVLGIHRWPVNSPHKGSVTRKMSPFDDVFMREEDYTRTHFNDHWLLLLADNTLCS